MWFIPLGKRRRELAISLVDGASKPLFVDLKGFLVKEIIHFPDRGNWDAGHFTHIFDNSPYCDGQIIVLEILILIAVISVQHTADLAAAGHANEPDLFSHWLIVQEHGARRFRHAVDDTDKAFALLDNVLPLFIFAVGVQILGNIIVFGDVKPNPFAIEAESGGILERLPCQHPRTVLFAEKVFSGLDERDTIGCVKVDIRQAARTEDAFHGHKS